MKKQKGAALIVVLSLLAVSLMIGLMSMQSSKIDERLAGNYKAATEAQMAAEFGAAYGFRKLHGQSEYFNSYDSDKSCDKFSKAGLSEQERRSVDGDVGWYEVKAVNINAEIIGCQDESGPLYLSWGQVRDGGGAIISESFVVFGDGGGDGDVLTINGSPPLSNPLVCLRSADDGCGWDDGDVASYFDGRPHPVPVDFNCNGGGCRTDPEGDDGEAVVYDAASRGDWDEYVNFLKSDPNRKSFSGGNNVFSQGDREGGGEVIVISGDVKQAGNINTYGVIVVEDSSRLELAGTGHHEGLIIVEEGGSLDLGNNYNVYGAVVALGEITLGGWSGKNPPGGVRYSAISSGEAGRPGDFVWQIL